MAKAPNRLGRLEKLLDVLDGESVQPQELIELSESLLGIVKANQQTLLSQLQANDTDSQERIDQVRRDIAASMRDVDAALVSLRQEKVSKQEIETAHSNFQKEIDRIAALIPVLPDEFDATDIYETLEEHREVVKNLSELILGENIRNALESLPEGEKLAIDAIEGLSEELNKRIQNATQTTAIVARKLYQFTDITNAATATDGQVLTANGDGTFTFETPSGGVGSGDMTKAVYDTNDDGIVDEAATITSQGALATKNTVATADIDNDAVTFDKIQNVATNRVLARSSAGTGSVEDLTLPQFRTLINVEDGATADQTGAEIKALYEAEANTNAFTDAEQTKLAGIETGADVTDTANVTAAGALMDSEVDADIKTLSLPANTTISAFGATLVDDADAATALATLGLTATAAELNTLDGITATVTELNYTDGVTSNIQAQLDAKAPTASPTFTGTTATDLITYDAARGKVTAGGNLGAAETINFNDETNYTGTLDSNITFTFSNATSGDDVTLYLSYDGTAQRTITWPTVTWLDNASGAAPATPSASGNVLVVTVRYIGTTYYASATGNYAVYA